MKYQFFRNLKQDCQANRGNPKIIMVLILFRMAQTFTSSNKFVYYLSAPFLLFYRVFVEWFLGIELHWKLKVGPGLVIHHGYGLVINPRTIVGAGCTLRHITTIGSKGLSREDGSDCPIIEDNVNIAPHVVILGPITIGANSIIGAGSVVTKDVPPNSVVVGNPAKIIKENTEK